MAAWCADITKTRWAGSPQFRLPYPGGDWYEERQKNQFLLTAMRHVVEADKIFTRVYKKSVEKWTDEATAFYREMLRGLQ